MQIESAVSENKIGFTLQGLKHFKLLWSGKERDFEPAGHGPDGDDLLIEIPRQDTGIEGYAAVFGKGAFGFFVQLISIGNLGGDPDNNLGRQVKTFPDNVVLSFVDIVLPEHLVLPSKVADKVRGFIGGFKSQFQSVKLFLSRIEFYLGNQLQGVSFQVLKLQYHELDTCQELFWS